MNAQLHAVGQMLGAAVDMVKGQLGDQFAVTLVARHRTGPYHMLLGDDDELGVQRAASELLRHGKHLIKDGVPVDKQDEPTIADQMVSMLRECADVMEDEGASAEARASNAIADRIKILLDKVDHK